MKQKEPENISVPSSVYTREYFQHCCQGHEEFNESLGTRLPPRLAIPLNLANLKPGMTIVDVGCGRGEVVLHCARQKAVVWGLDYALPALHIAQDVLAQIGTPAEKKIMGLMQSNARKLPFGANSLDVVFMLDVVEHLYPYELEEAFNEIRRCLRPGGKLIIHTMPNLWYYRWGYPVFRFLQGLRGQKLPKDPRDRWEFKHVHVNEQTPRKLAVTLRKCGFQSKIWLQTTQNYDSESNPWVRWVMNFLVDTYPFRWVYCNDIFAIGVKL